MKLHLPFSLRNALFALFAAATAQNAMASSMSSYVSQAVYADFGDNAGLYSVHGVNDLLSFLRGEEGGTFIYYSEDTGISAYNILQSPDQPLISFESRQDSGPAAAVSYNILATVEHNGVQNPTFTATKIGDSNAIHYAGIEYRKSGSTAEKAPFEEMNIFRLVPQTDFKITRLSKIVTDVSTYDFNTNHASTYKGEMWYRSGSGSMYHTGEDGQNVRWGGAYSYNVGGLMTISDSSDYPNYGTIPDYRGIMDTSGSVLTTYRWWLPSDIAGTIRQQPLPFAIQAGDSGSPTWIYDPETKTYLYSGAMQSANGSTLSQARYAGQWAKDTEEFFNKGVNLEGRQIVRIGAVNRQEPDLARYDAINNVTSRPWSGAVLTEGGEEITRFLGVQSGVNTWGNLNSLKDKVDWFNYGTNYLTSNNADKTEAAKLTYADLFYTENLLFKALNGENYDIRLDATVDTGLGYARFMKAEEVEHASFTVTGQQAAFQLNTSGFIVDKGVDLHLKLTGESGFAREWRKIGEGNLYIEGTGNNNDILLNLGGSGTTYLQRTEGYAAYNVLANNGTTVVIENKDQIKRDFTFGFGGALLNMNGESMTWNNDNDAAADGFTIHALTDEARITNAASGTTSTLTWTQGGTQEYLGSFVDTVEGASLQFIYDGGQDGRLVLHSIYTDLHNTGSGITVQSGTLALQGTVTQHAPGSLGAQFSNAKLVNNDDWHYADMTTPVTVNGGTFELGNHARLTGTVTVNAGGVFVMREGVTHQQEYLEGGYEIKNTDNYRDFFGLKGDVQLHSGAEMRIEFNDNVDSTLEYGHSIKGDGKLVVDPGIHGGSVTLSGNNMDFHGEKNIRRGGVTFSSIEALGDVSSNQWKLAESGFMASEQFEGMQDADILKYIHSDSTGILALTENRKQFGLADHKKLIIGAAEGKVVQYGEKDTTDTLTVWDGNNWHLGGGGGELVVNYKLTGNTNLVLGDEYAQGSVYLTNTANDFSGTIIFAGGVTLKYDSDDVLGDASFSLNYTNRVAPMEGLGKIKADSKGVLLLDRMNVQALDLTEHKTLALGTSVEKEYTGTIQVAENGDYLFGGSSAVLSLTQGLQANGTNGLKLDGQTYSGGEILLKAQAQITGDVEVRGYNQEATEPSCKPIGDITLGLGVDNAIDKVSSVTLKDGGYLDLHGTSQSIKNLSIEAGGALKDSGEGRLNLTLDKDVQWRGSVETSIINVTTNGKTLTMAGTANYNEMYITKGSNVALGANNSLSELGTTYVQSGAVLNTNGKSTEGNIVVESGGKVMANVSGNSFSGVVTLQQGGTMEFKEGGNMTAASTLVSDGGSITGHAFNLNGYTLIQSGTTTISGDSQREGGVGIGGTVEIADGAAIKLMEGYFSIPFMEIWTWFTISSAEFNAVQKTDEDGKLIESTGKLVVHTNDLRLQGENQNFGGVVELVNGNHFKTTKISADKGVKSFNRLVIDTNDAQFYQTNQRKEHLASGADWIIDHLDGSTGNLTAYLDNKHFVRIDGEGDFSKDFIMRQGTLQLAHENALDQACVKLTDSGRLSLGTSQVNIKGLISDNSSTLLYAGSTGDEATTQNATLRINTAADASYSFAGGVSSSSEKAVSLVKDGAGSQYFTGSAVAVGNVTVNEGVLGFTGADGANVHGDVNLKQGATLIVGGKPLELRTGQVFRVSELEDSGSAATFTGSLLFSGGGMEFAGGAISTENPVLALSGAALLAEGVSGMSVGFSDEARIENKTYTLASGDWSKLNGAVSSVNLIYHKAEFAASESQLAVTFADREDIQIWDGVTDKSSWTADEFGKEESRLNENMTAVFNDKAAFTNVSVNSEVAVKEMVFDNNANNYGLIAGANAGVTATTLRQVGEGSTTLMNGISVENAAVEAGTVSLMKGSSVETVSVEKSATLNLGEGSTVQSVEVAEGGTVAVQDYRAVVTGGISGDGTIQVNWSDTDKHSLNFKSIGTLEVQSGSVDMTEQGAQMNILHVKNGAVFSNDSQKEHYAHKAIVDEGGRLETSIGDYTTSGLVSNLEGKGTVVLVAGKNLVDLGDHAVTGGIVGASAFTGTLQLGNGENEFRFRSTNVTGLGAEATIVVEEKAQYWAGNGDATVQANMVLKGDSASSAGSSWKGEGFGAVRGVSNFNGSVTIAGNAMVSGTANIAFNADIKGEGDNATLTFGGYHGSVPAQTYTLAEGMKTEGLANMVVRLSGGKTTTVNVNSEEGLADNLKFESKVAGNGSVNVNASNSILCLESALGDGVVNIAQGKSLELTKGAEYGGQLNLAQDVTITATSDGVTRVTGGVKFASGAPGSALITGADGTRIENSIIDLAAGTRLEMANVILCTSSRITDDSAIIVANGLTVEAQLKPLTYAGTDHSQLEEPVEVASLTLDNIQNVVVEGAGENKGLLVHLVGMSDLGNVQWLQVNLGEDGRFADSLAVTLQYEDASGQHRVLGQYTMDEVVAKAAAEEAAMNHEFVYFRLTGNVPEPATGTLSLLALAALSARRRRK